MERFVLETVNGKSTIVSCGEMAYKWQRFVLKAINEQYEFTIDPCGEIAYKIKYVDLELKIVQCLPGEKLHAIMKDDKKLSSQKKKMPASENETVEVSPSFFVATS